MKVQIKRVYDPKESSDGLRVLVDRLWPRGISKDKVDVWLKDVAPSDTLRDWYNHIPMRWVSFRAKYRKELMANPDAVLQLQNMVGRKAVTLLYGARDTERNQAVVLVDYIRARGPAKSLNLNRTKGCG